jgi:hypothetical protein
LEKIKVGFRNTPHFILGAVRNDLFVNFHFVKNQYQTYFDQCVWLFLDVCLHSPLFFDKVTFNLNILKKATITHFRQNEVWCWDPLWQNSRTLVEMRSMGRFCLVFIIPWQTLKKTWAKKIEFPPAFVTTSEAPINN